jgi:UMF1 family MFS transporter
MVKYLGREMSTSSFAMYTFSTAVLIQAIVLILFSSFADHGMFSTAGLLSDSYPHLDTIPRSAIFLRDGS